MFAAFILATRCLIYATVLALVKAQAPAPAPAKVHVVEAGSKSETAVPHSRNQLEEIFVWKVSDELKLSVAEEKKLSEMIRELSQKKNSLNQESRDLVAQMSHLKVGEDKKRRQLLSKYRKNIDAYQKISLQEFDRIERLLGPTRSAKYLHIKQELTTRVKSLIAIDKSEKVEKADKMDKEKKSEVSQPPLTIDQ